MGQGVILFNNSGQEKAFIKDGHGSRTFSVALDCGHYYSVGDLFRGAGLEEEIGLMPV